VLRTISSKFMSPEGESKAALDKVPPTPLNPFNLNFFDSAQCLMVRRWRLIGYFPILYNPPPPPSHTATHLNS
jgi:hypothetical protein